MATANTGLPILTNNNNDNIDRQSDGQEMRGTTNGHKTSAYSVKLKDLWGKTFFGSFASSHIARVIGESSSQSSLSNQTVS